MDTNVLVVGIVITALFVVPFVIAFRHGRRGQALVRKVLGLEARKNNLKAARLEVFGSRGLALDVEKPALLWCEFDGNSLIASRMISLSDVVDCHVLVNNQFLSGNPSSNQAVTSVKLKLIFSRGDQMQESFTLFDTRSDDPMGAADVIGSARKWSRMVKASVSR